LGTGEGSAGGAASNSSVNREWIEFVAKLTGRNSLTFASMLKVAKGALAGRRILAVKVRAQEALKETRGWQHFHLLLGLEI